MQSKIEPAEIATLLRENASALELYASQWVNSPEDCVQDAFIELAKQQSRPVNVQSWLYRVVRNKAFNASRSANRRANHERLAAVLLTANAQETASEIELNDLTAAIELLSSDLRELVVLRIWSGLTWRQIADLTESSTSSVQRKYVVGLSKLKQTLESSCQKNFDCRQN